MKRHIVLKIVGIGYDGRKDKHTRAMVSDSFGQVRMRMIDEEHVSVSEEPRGKYLAHFVPDEPVHPEKPASKTAEALYDVLDIKGKHFIADAPYHILTSLRILRSQPQGGIIPVNLATRLTRNLKTSQEIFIGTLAKIPLTRNNFCQMNTITVTGIKCLSQEYNSCH